MIGSSKTRAVVTLGMVLLAGCASTRPPRPALADGLGSEGSGQYRVLLPPGYPAGGPYPAIYFLHDFFGSSSILWRKGIAAELERRMASGELRPFVLVAPEGGRDWWIDSFDGRWRYESWLHDRLIPEIEQRYRVIPGREGRAVTGISMGGFGALRSALRRPDLWSSASALSGALIPLDMESVSGFPWLQRRSLERVFGPVASPDAVYARNDVHTLALRPAPEGAPPILLQCGREDEYQLARAAEEVAARLERSGWRVTLDLQPGTHDWAYWRTIAVETFAWHLRQFPPTSPPDL